MSDEHEEDYSASESTIDKKQQLFIEYLISEPELFAKCYSISDPSYYDAPLDRAVKFSIDYFQKHGGIPQRSMIEAETGVYLKPQQLETASDMSYFLEEYELFCRQSAMAKAVLASADLVTEGNVAQVEELVREALLVKLDKSLGTNLFEDVQERIERMDEDLVNYSTGSQQVDDLVGNIRKGELIVTAASSSGGKSLHLANMGIALARQGLDVAIISLELNEALYAKRMDAMISGIAIEKHRKLSKEIADEMALNKEAMEDITIKEMLPQTTAADIRAYLLEYSLQNDKYPDVLIVDYIGIMGHNTKSSNKFDQDEEKAIALRRIAREYDMIVLTAQQLNREAANVTEVTYAHLAGGISLSNNSDALIAIVQSEQDIENNQVQIRGLKLRNAPKTTKPLILYRCPYTLRFSDEPNIMSGDRSKGDGARSNTSSMPSFLKDKLKENASKEEKQAVKRSKARAKLHKALGK